MQSTNPNENLKKKLSLKFQTLTKTKRIRDVPANFQALKSIVEALLKDEVSSEDVATEGF